MRSNELTFLCSRENWETGQNSHDLKDTYCEECWLWSREIFDNKFWVRIFLVKGPWFDWWYWSHNILDRRPVFYTQTWSSPSTWKINRCRLARHIEISRYIILEKRSQKQKQIFTVLVERQRILELKLFMMHIQISSRQAWSWSGICLYQNSQCISMSLQLRVWKHGWNVGSDSLEERGGHTKYHDLHNRAPT